jgi:hypothetical protein
MVIVGAGAAVLSVIEHPGEHLSSDFRLLLVVAIGVRLIDVVLRCRSDYTQFLIQ